jgi:integrase
VSNHPHGARHSYIAQRLQCEDGGRQVSIFTVVREVGHTTSDMIERTYGHVAKQRVRVDGFDYTATATRKQRARRLPRRALVG